MASLLSLFNLSHSALGLSYSIDFLKMSNFNRGPYPNFIEFQTLSPYIFIKKISFESSIGDSYSDQNMMNY